MSETANATINGGLGNKVLDGGAGGDALNAGIGNQVLIGGPGDTLKGGIGLDIFPFGPNFGLNTVKSFIPILDKIELSKSEFANFADVPEPYGAGRRQYGHHLRRARHNYVSGGARGQSAQCELYFRVVPGR